MSQPHKLYRLPAGPYLERTDSRGYLNSNWDDLFRIEDLYTHLSTAELTDSEASLDDALAPIVGQEVWACGGYLSFESTRSYGRIQRCRRW